MTSDLMDPIVYRNAMAHYAGHVQIVTTEKNGLRRGVTITAACSVSDSPPMVLACLNNGNANNQVFFESGVFALNSLGLRHQALASAFAGFGGLAAEDRFALGTGNIWPLVLPCSATPSPRSIAGWSMPR